MRYFFLFLIFSSGLNGQDYNFKLDVTGGIDLKLRKEIEALEKEHSDSLYIQYAMNKAKTILYKEGYFLSEAVLRFQQKKALLEIKVGKSFNWAELNILLPNDFVLVLPQSISLKNSSVNSDNFSTFTSKYLNYLENNGYPFAQISFSEYQVTNDTITGSLNINPGPFITLDSLVIKGYDKINHKKLQYYFLFKKGMTYNEAYLKELNTYVNQIEHITFSRPPAVAFAKGKTVLYLYLTEVKSNQIDGVIGLNTEENGDITFNGDFKLRLLNTLKKGEELKIRWRKPDDGLSELDLDFTIPFLFNTPFLINGNLNIFRQDSAFVNTKAQGLIKYLIQGGSFLSFGINYHSSNVLLKDDAVSGNLNSFKTTAYKFGFEKSSTNRILIPTKGNRLEAYTFTATRTANSINTQQYGWSLNESYYLPFFKNHILKLELQSEGLISENLFENELYRIGGLKKLRGFNEQSIYSSTYGIGTLEYRYMIGEYDYITVFTDIGYVENKPSSSVNRFYGIGTGLNFRTGGGIFSLFYALGRDDQNPFDFTTSKIHFGYINRF